MTTYQLTKTERSFTIGKLTLPIGSVLMEKKGDFIKVYSDQSSVTFHYSDIIGILGETFASSDLAITYLEENLFKVGGGNGDGVTSTDVSSMVLITEAAYDALDPKVSTTLYLIPVE